MNSTELETVEALAEYIEKNGEIMISTRGISMYPMLRSKRDVSVIRAVDRPFRVNDVPVYRSNSGKPTMHRIIAIKNGRYIIRGDNLLVKETNVTDEKIIGRLVAFYREGKYYDCEKSKAYKFYVFVISHTFFLRYSWKKFIRPMLSKIKHTIIRKK